MLNSNGAEKDILMRIVLGDSDFIRSVEAKLREEKGNRLNQFLLIVVGEP
jgi:hypothetical protein